MFRAKRHAPPSPAITSGRMPSSERQAAASAPPRRAVHKQHTVSLKCPTGHWFPFSGGMTQVLIGLVSLRECPRFSGPSQPLELTSTTPCLEPCQRPPCREATSAYFGGSPGCQSSRCSTSRGACAVRRLPPSQRREMSTTSGSRQWPLRGRYEEPCSHRPPSQFSCPRSGSD